MAPPRPTWRNIVRGLAAVAAADVPSSGSEPEEPCMPKTKRTARLASVGQLPLLASPKAPIARLAVDRQAHMACADNLDFMRSLKSGSMKLIVTSPPYNIGKSYERRRSLDNYIRDQAQVISECVRLLRV